MSMENNTAAIYLRKSTEDKVGIRAEQLDPNSAL